MDQATLRQRTVWDSMRPTFGSFKTPRATQLVCAFVEHTRHTMTRALDGINRSGTDLLSCIAGSATAIVLVTALGCGPGFSSANPDLAPCLPCALGTYAPGQGTTVCIKCPSGSFAMTTGSTSVTNCTACQPGSCSGHGSCQVVFGATGPIDTTCDCDVRFESGRCW